MDARIHRRGGGRRPRWMPESIAGAPQSPAATRQENWREGVARGPSGRVLVRSARAWPLGGERGQALGRGCQRIAVTHGHAEQERRDRRGRAVDLVGGVTRQVEYGPLVDYSGVDAKLGARCRYPV